MQNKSVHMKVVALLVIMSGLSNCGYHIKTERFLKSSGSIDLVELEINSENGQKITSITNKVVLDSLQDALTRIREVAVPLGGLFKIWAMVTVNKNNDQVNFMVMKSYHHGWYVYISGKTFECKYLYELVERYH